MVNLFVPEGIPLKGFKIEIFKMFAQGMLNRLVVGELRYGPTDKRQRYDLRAAKEMKAYKETGNAEHLINIANYCVLEWIAPGHPKHYFDSKVDSVTRDAANKT